MFFSFWFWLWVIVAYAAGIITGLFIFKNNKEKADKITDKIEESFDDIKDQISKN